MGSVALGERDSPGEFGGGIVVIVSDLMIPDFRHSNQRNRALITRSESLS